MQYLDVELISRTFRVNVSTIHIKLRQASVDVERCGNNAGFTIESASKSVLRVVLVRNSVFLTNYPLSAQPYGMQIPIHRTWEAPVSWLISGKSNTTFR